jgi:hypothetical protein
MFSEISCEDASETRSLIVAQLMNGLRRKNDAMKTEAGTKKQFENFKITQWLYIKYFNLQIIIHCSLFIF